MFIWIGLVRFLVEFLRIGNWRIGTSTAQLFGAAFVLIGVEILVVRRRQGRHGWSPSPAARMTSPWRRLPPAEAEPPAGSAARAMPEARTTSTTSTSSTPCAARPTGRRSDRQGSSTPEKRPRSRLRPQALAAARGGAKEGSTGSAAGPKRGPHCSTSFGSSPASCCSACAASGSRPRAGSISPGPWLPAHRCRPSRLDGPVRRDARGPIGAALLVPRERTVDVHLVVSTGSRSIASVGCSRCGAAASGSRVTSDRRRPWSTPGRSSSRCRRAPSTVRRGGSGRSDQAPA